MKSSVYRRPCNYNIIDFEFKTQVYIVFFLQNNDVSFEKSFVSFVKLKIWQRFKKKPNPIRSIVHEIV